MQAGPEHCKHPAPGGAPGTVSIPAPIKGWRSTQAVSGSPIGFATTDSFVLSFAPYLVSSKHVCRPPGQVFTSCCPLASVYPFPPAHPVFVRVSSQCPPSPLACNMGYGEFFLPARASPGITSAGL